MSDGVATTQALSDLENQAAGFPPASPLPITGGRNYEYDGSGNLVYDRSEGTLIKWNAQGKVAEVRKDQFGVSQTTKFWYNAAGNRVKKQVINHLAADPEESSVTYYVRDANEAVMAIYQQTVLHASGPPGCLRKPNNGGIDMDMDGVVDGGCDKCTNGVPPAGGSSWNPWQEDYDKDGMGDACDPCPFIFGSACDPQQPGLPAMPEQWTGVATTTKLAELPIYGSERLGLMRPNVLRDTVIVINPTPSIFTRRVDQKEYELKDHLGNVRVVVSDMKKRVGDLTATFTLRVKSVNAYYAFGMLEEGMSGSSEGYRYGFQGQEMDNEINGVGNFLAFEYRIHDTRLDRFLSIDPLTPKYPSQSPYVFSENRVIASIELEGLEAIDVNTGNTNSNINTVKLKQMKPEKLFEEYKDLINYKVSNDVINSTNARLGEYSFVNKLVPLILQPIENAASDALNIDYYSVKISQMPFGFTNFSLFQAIRINLPNLTIGGETDFSAYNEQEMELWKGVNPIGVVMHFDAGGDSWWPPANPDDLTVLCTKATMNYWIFSPVTSFKDGTHPVAGNRQFGLTSNNDGSYTFFTRGADRPWALGDGMLQSLIWPRADKLWRAVMQNVANTINMLGGKASMNEPFVTRISWTQNAKKK